jgi:hypothetical protein
MKRTSRKKENNLCKKNKENNFKKKLKMQKKIGMIVY